MFDCLVILLPALHRKGLTWVFDPIKLQPVPLQPIPEAAGNGFFEGFDFRVAEFDYLTSRHVDQMIMVLAVGIFPTRAPVAKFATLQQPCLLKGFYRAIHSGNGNPRIELRGTRMQGLDVGMIVGGFEDLCNHPALPGEAQPFGLASSHEPLLRVAFDHCAVAFWNTVLSLSEFWNREKAIEGGNCLG